MRVVETREYTEPRDALAQDWPAFFDRVLPEASFLFVPNVDANVLEYARRWELDGFVLSGGNDIGASRVRDRTEIALLGHAMERRLPVFGVCRGLQLLHTHFGGALAPVMSHAATTHEIEFTADHAAAELRGARKQVNSYHDFGIRRTELASPLRAEAWSSEGFVESATIEGYPVRAVMWHPERASADAALDRFLFRSTFGW
jgi:putative glutamine amidotransferase